MPLSVADVRANLNETIRHAARIIGKSSDRLKVFEEIYRGKRKIKTVTELAKSTGLSHVRVLQEGGKLAGNGIVEQTQVHKRTAYKKDPTYVHHKTAIVDLFNNPGKKSKYPTKQEPRVREGASIHKIVLAKSLPQPQIITIDDVESFSGAPATVEVNLTVVPEERIKRFLKLVIGETAEFKDWGGEKNDLYTNKMRFRGRRRTAALAIKGRATKGTLTPKKMGKNGDQVGRLMSSDADIFFVVYHSKIDQSVIEQMRAYALGRSMAGRHTHYGSIDGQDLRSLVAGHASEWRRSALR